MSCGTRFAPQWADDIGLTGCEWAILSELMSRPYTTGEGLVSALVAAGFTVTTRTVPRRVWALRARLKPHGVEVTTNGWRGYGLSESARLRLIEIISNRRAA